MFPVHEVHYLYVKHDMTAENIDDYRRIYTDLHGNTCLENGSEQNQKRTDEVQCERIEH